MKDAKKDEWLCFADITKQLAMRFPPCHTPLRVYESRDNAIEHFFIESFAIPRNYVSEFLKQATFSEEQTFESKSDHLKLLHPKNGQFLCQKFARKFDLQFANGTCCDIRHANIAYHHIDDQSMDEYIEIDRTYLKEFLVEIDHVLLLCISALRYSERLFEEWDFSGIVREQGSDAFRFSVTAKPDTRKFRMNTEVSLFGKTIVDL